MHTLPFEPNNIQIYLTSTCNLACRYCWNQRGSFGQEEKSLMKQSTAEAVVSFIRNQILNNNFPYLGISFFGGEPLLNPRVLYYLTENLLKLKEETGCNLRLLIFTNGTIYDPPLFELVKERRDVECHIGFDGPGEIHDKYRVDLREQGSYLTVRNNIRRLIAEGVFVAAESVISRPYDYLALLAEYDALGIPFAFIQEEIIPYHGKEQPRAQVEALDLEAWEERYAEFLDHYFRRIVAGNAPMLEPLFTGIKWFTPQKERPVLACTAGTRQIAISQSGEIHACNQLQNNAGCLLGDVLAGVDQRLLGEFHQTLLTKGEVIFRNEVCRECPLRFNCKGGCYSRNLIETGDLGIIGNSASCAYKLKKAQLDLTFIKQMLSHFPDFKEDVLQRRFAKYFPVLTADIHEGVA